MQDFEISKLQKAVGPHYNIVQRIAHSAHSSIYLLQSKSEGGGILALKVFNSVTPNTVDATRIENEIRTACMVSHPNVIKGYQKLHTEHLIGYAMEFAQGGNLAQLLNKQQKLAINEVLRLGAELCAGLEAIHSHGIIHRNIGLSNLLFSKEGTLKISDFGVTQFTQEERITRHSDILGSFHYISPEYLRNGTVDRRSDIYAVGMVLYELTTGKRPFGSSPHLHNLMRRLEEDPVSPRKLRDDCPVGLEKIILTALQREPSARYENATVMLKNILAFRPSVTVDSSLQEDNAISESALLENDILKVDREEEDYINGSNELQQKLGSTVDRIHEQGSALLRDTKQLFSFSLVSVPTIVIGAILCLVIMTGIRAISSDTTKPKNKVTRSAKTAKKVPAKHKKVKVSDNNKVARNKKTSEKKHYQNHPAPRPIRKIPITDTAEKIRAERAKREKFHPRNYTIAKGDTLERIARKMNVSLDELIELNNIKNPNILSIGKTILIPPERN